MVHIVASGALAVMLVAHCALTAVALRGAGAQAAARASAACTVVGAVAVLGFAVVTGAREGPAGLCERTAVLVMGVHGALLAVRLLRRPTGRAPTGASPRPSPGR